MNALAPCFRLDKWLKAHQLGDIRFGQLCGLNESCVRSIRRRGSCLPRNGARIYAATGGEVDVPYVGIHRRGHENVNKADLKRWARVVAAREYGVTLDDIADRFGFKNANSAKAIVGYARKMLGA